MRQGWPVRQDWMVALIAAVIAAAARAACIGLRDRYAAIGLHGLATYSASRHFLEGLAPCIAAGLLFEWWLGRTRGRPVVRVVSAACAVIVAYLFVSGRLPSMAAPPPRTHGLDSKIAQLGPWPAAVAIASLLAFGTKLGATVVRASALAAAVLTVAAAVARLLPISSSGGSDPAARARHPHLNVVLISLDTVRADHLGCYGHPQPTTPEIDRFFARHSARFEAAFAPQPWTLTSHLTMLTSLHPIVHGVTAERGLPPEVRTLAELLADAGYLTFGHAHRVPWMARRYGFGRGFHVYRRFSGGARDRQKFVDALLDDLRHERFFLFLHYYDAHSDRGELPYDAEPADRGSFTQGYRGGLAARDEHGRDGTDRLWWMNRDRRALAAEDRRYLAALYAAGLRSLDRALGGLFRSLESRGLLESTIVVLTADHGEEFQEHGRLLHTQAYDECMRVPLLFRLPGSGPLRVSSELVGLDDVAPTILDLCGLVPPEDMQGRSLRAAIDGRVEQSERSHLLLMDEDGRAALRTASWKLVTGSAGHELYDLVNDPAEQRDWMAETPPPPAAAGLLRLLEQEQQRAFALRAKLGISDAAGVSLSASELETLRALGYLGDS